MRCHIVQVTAAGITATRLAATAAEAKTVREDLMAEFDVPKKHVSIEQHEVPSDKPGLLGYLNEVYTKMDTAAGDDE